MPFHVSIHSMFEEWCWRSSSRRCGVGLGERSGVAGSSRASPTTVIRMAVSHTTPMELTNHSAVEVTGSMLPLVVNTRRLKNSATMSIGVAVGTKSSWRTEKPTAVYRSRPKPTQSRRRPAWRNDLRRERAVNAPERDQHEQQQPAVEHEVGGALGARVDR